MNLPNIEARPDLYDEAERWSVDELRARQLERLQWSVRHALRPRAALPQGVRGQGRPPRRHPVPGRHGLLAVHQQGRPARQLPVRDVRRAARAGRRGCTPPAARPASRPSSATPPRTSTTWSALMARSIRAAGGRPGDVVHVAYGYGLFTGGLGAHYGAEPLGCTVVPVSGGMTERQVQLIADFAPRVIMVTPSYFLSVLDEMERRGHRPARHLAGDRHLRRRAVDRRDAAPRSRSGPGCTRSTSTGCPR